MDPTQALQILFDWFASLLPADMLNLAIGMAPVVAAIVALALLIPWVKERKKWAAPTLALIFGVVFGLATMQTAGATIPQALLFGLVVALLAVGGVSATKNVIQGVAGPTAKST